MFDTVRAFIEVDLELTLRIMTPPDPSTERLLCAPALFSLWLLDGLEEALSDVLSLTKTFLRWLSPGRLPRSRE